MIDRKHSNLVFGFFLTFMMTFLVSGISTLLAIGLEPRFLLVWFQAWMSSWVVAFPAVLVVAPLTRRIVARLVTPEGKP